MRATTRRPSRAYHSFATHGELNLELLRHAYPQHSSSAATTLNAFTATLQPYARPNFLGNEDRCVVQRWTLPSGEWTFAAVFDGMNPPFSDAFASIVICYFFLKGHAGAETAEYASVALPNVIREHIAPACNAVPILAEDITARLGQAIHAFDDSLVNDLRDALPEDIEGADDADLRACINDQAAGGRTYAKVVRCMRGCTALIALIDPSTRNCWVANLGDGQAGEVRSKNKFVRRLFN